MSTSRFNPERLKVAIIAEPTISIPPEQYGGTEQVVYYLVKGLKEAGHVPILLASGDSKVDCELVPIVPKAMHYPKKLAGRAAYERQIKSIHRRMKKMITELLPRVDIIHSHGFDLKGFQHTPNLTTLHNMINFDELEHYEDREDLFYASISKNQQGAFPELKYMGVVYNGEDPAMFPIVREPEDYVCFLGRFEREKSPHLAIQLAIKLGLHIKLGGKIDYHGEGYFEEEVEPYFDHPLVEYMGELDFKHKVELLSKARCNFHPTGFREPFGLSVLEAAYCGVPTLAINRGAMPEIIEDGRTGVLIEDFVEGYHRIEECFLMDRMYIAQRARLLFNYKTMAHQYVETYIRVLEAFNESKAA